MSGIAVIFPGIGYNIDKPLLYYSKKIAMNKGFENFVNVEYKDLTFNKGTLIKDKAAQREVFKKCLLCANESLKDINWSEYDKILFISKSIGTIVASAVSSEMNANVKHILFTPLEETFEYKVNDALGFIGTADPWSDYKKVLELAKKQNIPMHSFDGANHSIETKDVLKDIGYIKETMEIVESFIE